MTKEEYTIQKLKNQIDITAAWEMYQTINHDKPKIDFANFSQLFPMWLSTFGSNCEKYWEFYNKKYEN